ncbi:hypothetical protein GALMADRAFT_150249 [Galerina marginata CBS 339.88]|uniref:F-box domain-containing protein n=1 Tax=Galerina marginata (strain CBS 339.88) TaxID=685588 RepID=A0A067U382_GALM3|nr:hypothetical protein GALMADRAFT_150249 [Galerina marginata CBS 339.88]
MTPLGTNLTLDQLLTALNWKLENESETIAPIDLSHSQREDSASTWSRRILESKCITSHLQQCLNALPPVNCLPREIIGEIFLYVQSLYQYYPFLMPQHEFTHRTKPSNSWTRVTRVCRYWRDIAFNTKTLWCTITLTDRLEFAAFPAISLFTQSYPLPITLDHRCLSDIKGEHVDDFYATLAQNANRISVVYLRTHLPPKAIDLVHSIPNLMELELDFRFPTDSDDNDFSPQNRSVYTESFLDRHTSTLRKLSLSHYLWPQQAFTGLTHLCLQAKFAVTFNLFFQMLASVSSTLQFLKLECKGTLTSRFETYEILTIEKRPVMIVLQYLEMHSVSGGLMQHLYNLFLPNNPTLIWNCAWTKYFGEYTDGPDKMTMIPPPEQLARVTSLVAWTFWEKRYFLKGTTLHFPALATFSNLAAWSTHLPNLVTLALYGHNGSYYDLPDLLTKFTTLECLHFCSTPKLPFLMVELEQEVEKTDFLPRLQTLIACSHNNRHIKRQLSKEFAEQELQPLELGEDRRMLRTRPHLDRTYTLFFSKKCINGHVANWQDYVD